ncbi:MAG: D-aminoacylase [Desulfobacteraceae bacterium]|nr:D-aminoacylase [Desulfobacteraceae bacterium]
MIDCIIKNGRIIDGTGSEETGYDVGIDQGKIVTTGSLDETIARNVIDASGAVVAPGFIDMHSHADLSLPVIPTADSVLHQGITTVVFGQCGITPAPIMAPYRDQLIDDAVNMMGHLTNGYPWEKWTSFGEYLAYIGNMKISCNVVPLVGHGIIRNNIMGFGPEKPTKKQLEGMRSEVEKAMDAGAFGISSGLIYPPGCYSSTEELIDLSRVVANRGGFYFSHIRGENETLGDAVAEAISIGRETGVSVQISHFKAAGKANWPLSAQTLRQIEEARSRGIDVSSDMYPYLAGSTSLVTMLPEWAHDGGPKATLERLKDSGTRTRMASDMASGGFSKGVEWDTLLITDCQRRREWEGRYISEIAGEAGVDPFAWLFDSLLETGLGISMAIFAMSEENRKQEMKHPFMMFGTDGVGLMVDGPYAQGKPHPRSYGTFPRVLGHYVRETGVMSLEEAIHKMTGLPAKTLRLADRGTITTDTAADIVIFDPKTITDNATYEDPHRYASGIHHVMVNGSLVIQDSQHTGTRPGKVLRLG